MTDINIKGMAELKRALEQLPAKLEANVMRGAMRAGAKVIADAAKDNVHNVSGALAASITVATRVKAGKVTGRVVAGGKGKKQSKKGKGSAFYAHMVEYGTKAHVIEARAGHRLSIHGHFVRRVNHPGARPRPYMRPALDTQASLAVLAVREYIRGRLSTQHGIDVPAPLQEGDE